MYFKKTNASTFSCQTLLTFGKLTMYRYGNDLESRFLFEHNIAFQNNKSNTLSDILTNLVKTEKYYMGSSFISVPAGN